MVRVREKSDDPVMAQRQKISCYSRWITSAPNHCEVTRDSFLKENMPRKKKERKGKEDENKKGKGHEEE